MIFLLDNYDSFTYNLYQYLGELGIEVRVARNDKIQVTDIMHTPPAAVVISPGPGRPAAAGISKSLVRECARRRLPLLGVCLGHQALGEEFGAAVEPAQTLMHGKTSLIRHDNATLFAGLDNPQRVMRYHSLVIRRGNIPADFSCSASNQQDGELMAMRHKTLPLEGVQFHPESIMTSSGKMMLQNFVNHYLK